MQSSCSVIVFERVGLWATGQQLEPHLVHVVALRRTTKPQKPVSAVKLVWQGMQARGQCSLARC